MVRTVTNASAAALDSSPCVLLERPERSARLDRARRPGREPGGGLSRPLLHDVFDIAPLPLRRRLDRSAPDPLVDPLTHQLTCLGIGHLCLCLRAADEGVGPGGEVLEC